jgi:hypothetical protein
MYFIFWEELTQQSLINDVPLKETISLTLGSSPTLPVGNQLVTRTPIPVVLMSISRKMGSLMNPNLT